MSQARGFRCLVVEQVSWELNDVRYWEEQGWVGRQKSCYGSGEPWPNEVHQKCVRVYEVDEIDTVQGVLAKAGREVVLSCCADRSYRLGVLPPVVRKPYHVYQCGYTLEYPSNKGSGEAILVPHLGHGA